MSVIDSRDRPIQPDWQNLSDRPAWQTAAACRGLDPNLFYVERGESTTEARTVCASCPVTVECLDFALTNHEKFGVWGGKSERERRRLRRTPPASVPVIGVARICSCCGTTFRPARRDQRFCTADCRTFHYTEVARGA